MKEFGLHIATIVSLLFHSFIIIIFTLVIKRNIQYFEPKEYIVSIVTPAEVNSTPAAPINKTPEPLPAAKNEPVIPPKPEQKKIEEKAPIEEKKLFKEIVKEKTPAKEVVKEKEITPEERIAQLKESLKKKKQASDDSIETKKSEQLQKFRSLASIRKGLSDTAVNTKTQSDTKTQSAYSDINSPQMKAQGEQYYDNVRKYIMEFWSYPDMGKKSMLAIISFSVDVNGSISNIRIEKSSGDSLYDSQARYAVIKSNPLPKPPFEMELGIRFSQ